jgi:Choline/ethanolamine kinase
MQQCSCAIFGAEVAINAEERAVENTIFAQLAEAKLAPPLLGMFANSRIEQWPAARCVTLDEMRDDDVMHGATACVSDLHRFYPAGERGSERPASVWDPIDNWIRVGRGSSTWRAMHATWRHLRATTRSCAQRFWRRRRRVRWFLSTPCIHHAHLANDTAPHIRDRTPATPLTSNHT